VPDDLGWSGGAQGTERRRIAIDNFPIIQNKNRYCGIVEREQSVSIILVILPMAAQ
jgi:hypothetical protein